MITLLSLQDSMYSKEISNKESPMGKKYS
jgi:hypothetical protein